MMDFSNHRELTVGQLIDAGFSVEVTKVGNFSRREAHATIRKFSDTKEKLHSTGGQEQVYCVSGISDNFEVCVYCR